MKILALLLSLGTVQKARDEANIERQGHLHRTLEIYLLMIFFLF